MNEEQKHDGEQLKQNGEGLPLAAEPDPDVTLIAPWNKGRRELGSAAMPGDVKPLPPDPLGYATVPDDVEPLSPEDVAVSGDVKPLIPAAMKDTATPDDIKPPTSEPVTPLQPRSQTRIGRRALLIGGATAVVIVGSGALAMTLIRQTFQKPSSASLTVRPVHFTAGQSILRLTGHTAAVNNVVWSPDGRYLASACEEDAFAMLWDITTFLRRAPSGLQTIDRPTRQWNVYPYGLAPETLWWTPDGRYLLTDTGDDSLMSRTPALLDPFSNTSKMRVFTDRNIRHPYFRYPMMSPQGSTLAALDGTVYLHRYHKVDLWQLDSPTEPYASLTYMDANQFIGDSSGMYMIAWSPDGAQLAGLTSMREVVIWDTKKRTLDAVVKLPERGAKGKFIIRVTLAWSPGHPGLLAASNFDTIALINVQQKKVLYQLSTDDKGAFRASEDPDLWPHVLGIAWSPDGRYLAASYALSAKVFVWDMQAKNARTGHGLTFQSALFPPDGSTGQLDTIYDLAWSPDGRYLATASSDHSITIWKVES